MFKKQIINHITEEELDSIKQEIKKEIKEELLKELKVNSPEAKPSKCKSYVRVYNEELHKFIYEERKD